MSNKMEMQRPSTIELKKELKKFFIAYGRQK